jgi:hypothetical protein
LAAPVTNALSSPATPSPKRISKQSQISDLGVHPLDAVLVRPLNVQEQTRPDLLKKTGAARQD